MEEGQSLFGLCLAGESDKSSDQVIGVLRIATSINAEACRSLVRNALPESMSDKKFVFLTSKGWEVNEDLEKVVKTLDLVTADGLIKIRLVYEKPRVGILVEGGETDTPVGFVFCDRGHTLDQFLLEVEQQLPTLHQALSHPSNSYAILDRNGWPVSRDQQRMLTVLEVMVSCAVKIRLFRQSRRVSTHQMYSLQDSTDATDHPGAYRRSISAPSSVSSGVHLQQLQSLALPLDKQRSLSPVQEIMEVVPEDFVAGQIGPTVSDMDCPVHAKGDCYEFEILLSYVHSEASDCALLLKDSLERLGYSVFLDVHCIQGGADWQDALNEAISNCSLFVPLVTMQYGETLWTNREVKLADVLGKIIIPVNFLSNWPPKCLAIQFATTQFIRVPFGSQTDLEVSIDQFDSQLGSSVATDISSRYKQELRKHQINANFEQRIFGDGELDEKTTLSRQDTVEMCDSAATPTSAGSTLSGPPPVAMSRKKSMLKSYASTLPRALPEEIRKSIVESREGKPLVVISCAKKERDFALSVVKALSTKNVEVWCSCDIDSSISDDGQRSVFQSKVDEAGVVIFILSKEFANCTFCEQQVYYCEQRKRIVPVIYESMQLPNWMAMLIGTSTFVHRKSEGYLEEIVDRVGVALDQRKSQEELQDVQKQKATLAKLCSRLTNDLPPGKHVYISGSTVFYSSCGKEICEELGRQLAQDPEITLITGGFFGVGETVGRSFFDERTRLQKPHGVCHVIAERDDQDKSHQTRQRADRTFEPVPYGDTLFYGDSVRQREMLTPRVIDLCILVEGGPGAAFEAQQFTWNGNRVIPIKVTGGAAGGSFNVPPAILIRPPGIAESDWSLLGDKTAMPTEIASAVVRIVQTLKSSQFPTVAISRSRSNTGSMLDRMELKRSQLLLRRGTLPERMPSERDSPSGRDGPSVDSLKRAASLSSNK